MKQKEAFAPFSAGPFGCIGKNLALMELRTLTTRLVFAYDMKLAPGTGPKTMYIATMAVPDTQLKVMFKARD